MPYNVPEDYPVESLRGKHFDFEWEATIGSRSAGNKCPFLAGQDVWKGFNDLATVNPELAAQWNYEKNGDLTPEDVTPNANRKVWWKLPYDVPMDYPVESLRGKHFDFEWKSTISHRNSQKRNCPYLSSNAVWPGFNDLATTNPELASQWNYEKNGDLKPTDVMADATQKVWWKVPYDVPMDYPVESLRGKHFDFEWKATITQRNRQPGCPYLSGNGVWPGFNDLATVNPELAKEWACAANAERVSASVYYEKKTVRDLEARRAYRNTKRSKDNINELFILDIMREGITNGDPRLR